MHLVHGDDDLCSVCGTIPCLQVSVQEAYRMGFAKAQGDKPTLRDMLARDAMKKFVGKKIGCTYMDHVEIAARAYRLADAMLDQKER